MSRNGRRGRSQPPFEEWDGSNGASREKPPYNGPERRARRSSPSSGEIDRMIEAAVRERARPAPGWRQPVRSSDPLGAQVALDRIQTLDDLWPIWSLAPAPREPEGREDN